VAPVQLGEVWDPFAEQHRHEADTHLIHQAEVECLLGDLRARDGDVLAAGDLPGLGDRGFNAVDERRSRPPPGGILGCAMGDHDDGSACRVVVIPAVGNVEQVSSGDERTGVSGQLSEHLRTGVVDLERDLLIRGRHGNVPGPVPVEQFPDLIIRVRDEPIQRHRHVGEHFAHRQPPARPRPRRQEWKPTSEEDQVGGPIPARFTRPKRPPRGRISVHHAEPPELGGKGRHMRLIRQR